MQREGKQFSSILDQVLYDFGPELLNDVSRFNAILMDYAPNYSKERKLLCSVLKENILSDIRNNALYGGESEQILTRCVYRLKNDLWLSEEAAAYAVKLLLHAMGITLKDDNDLEHSSAESTGVVITKGSQIVTQTNIGTLLQDYEAIGYKAFACNSDITEVRIPENITKVYPRAFSNCIALQSVYLPNNIQKIGGGVFYGCYRLQSIQAHAGSCYAVIDGALIEKKTATLIRVANEPGKKVSFVPRGIKRIASYAYDHSLVTEIRISRDVESIEHDSFYRCDNLEQITIEGHSRFFRTYNGVLYDGTGKTIIKYPPGRKDRGYMLEEDVESIHANAFSHAIYLESLTFNSRLRTIGRKAFEKCDRIESLVFPSCVSEIEERAFQDCKLLKNVMLPRGILEIGDYAFSGCVSIATLSIPASVERIGNGAFAGCINLKSIILQKKVCFIGDGVFEECPKELVVRVHSNPYVEAYCQARGMEFEKI